MNDHGIEGYAKWLEELEVGDEVAIIKGYGGDIEILFSKVTHITTKRRDITIADRYNFNRNGYEIKKYTYHPDHIEPITPKLMERKAHGLIVKCTKRNMWLIDDVFRKLSVESPDWPELATLTTRIVEILNANGLSDHDGHRTRAIDARHELRVAAGFQKAAAEESETPPNESEVEREI